MHGGFLWHWRLSFKVCAVDMDYSIMSLLNILNKYVIFILAGGMIIKFDCFFLLVFL